MANLKKKFNAIITDLEQNIQNKERILSATKEKLSNI